LAPQKKFGGGDWGISTHKLSFQFRMPPLHASRVRRPKNAGESCPCRNWVLAATACFRQTDEVADRGFRACTARAAAAGTALTTCHGASAIGIPHGCPRRAPSLVMAFPDVRRNFKQWVKQ
jgi:hypothetical protein